MGNYNLLINFIINIHISFHASIRRGISVNTSQQTGKEQYILQILFHNIAGENTALALHDLGIWGMSQIVLIYHWHPFEIEKDAGHVCLS